MKVSLKLEGKKKQTKTPNQNLLCPRGRFRFSHFITVISKTGL